MDMRLRLPELLEEHDVTAYELAKRSGGRLDMSTLYRLTRKRGVVRYLDMELAQALCDTLGIEPAELLERDGKRKGRK